MFLLLIPTLFFPCAQNIVSAAYAESDTLRVHFLDVGQGDAALVVCGDHAMLIDGGSPNKSDIIYSCLKRQNINYLDYIVCTHAHEDHVGGLSGALNYAKVGVALCPVSEDDSKPFRSFVKYLDEQGVEITIPTAGTSFPFGSATVEVLGPVGSGQSVNNTSIVLRIVHGNVSFLFTGDAERDEEQAILNAGYNLNSTVLKVGHHGSDTSTSYVWLREIMPEYAVISVGSNNANGHPTEEVLSRLRDANVKTFRTDMQGNIVMSSDGKSVLVGIQRNADADTLAAVGLNSQQRVEKETVERSGTLYILNTNTKKFHYPDCSSVQQMKNKNKKEFTGVRDDVISMGYKPCKKCNP